MNKVYDTTRKILLAFLVWAKCPGSIKSQKSTRNRGLNLIDSETAQYCSQVRRLVVELPCPRVKTYHHRSRDVHSKHSLDRLFECKVGNDISLHMSTQIFRNSLVPWPWLQPGNYLEISLWSWGLSCWSLARINLCGSGGSLKTCTRESS